MRVFDLSVNQHGRTYTIYYYFKVLTYSALHMTETAGQLFAQLLFARDKQHHMQYPLMEQKVTLSWLVTIRMILSLSPSQKLMFRNMAVTLCLDPLPYQIIFGQNKQVLRNLHLQVHMQSTVITSQILPEIFLGINSDSPLDWVPLQYQKEPVKKIHSKVSTPLNSNLSKFWWSYLPSSNNPHQIVPLELGTLDSGVPMSSIHAFSPEIPNGSFPLTEVKSRRNTHLKNEVIELFNNSVE